MVKVGAGHCWGLLIKDGSFCLGFFSLPSIVWGKSNAMPQEHSDSMPSTWDLLTTMWMTWEADPNMEVTIKLNVRRKSESGQLSQATAGFLTYRNYEIIKVSCFTQSLEETCYIEIENWYIWPIFPYQESLSLLNDCSVASSFSCRQALRIYQLQCNPCPWLCIPKHTSSISRPCKWNCWVRR